MLLTAEYSRLIGFDPQLLFDAAITAVNIFILFFGLSYLLFNPVRDYLKKRHDRIASEIEESKNAVDQANKMKAEYEAKLKEATREAQGIIEEGRRNAKMQEADIVNRAHEEAGRILERADREMKLEQEKAVDEMKQQVITIAALMAEKFVSRTMSAQEQDALFEETLKEIGEGTWQN